MPKTNFVTLTQYLTTVKSAVSELFAYDVWVVAEIRAISSKGGHYYLELADKTDDGVSASCRATLWRFKAEAVMARFAAATGGLPSANMQVMLCGRASFHPQYGFAFNISDINPDYTLGVLAAAYQQMVQALQDNGLLTLNKQHELPFDLQHVAVITPKNAAGLGDFQAQADVLQSCGVCDFSYYYATFQGNQAPSELRARLQDIVADNNADLIVIIRGGGAVGDLAYLNDYELAALIAECPRVVWTGIGHERDTTLLDEVAHTAFGTPSKVIAALWQYLLTRWQGAQRYWQTISRASQHYVTERMQTHSALMDTVKLASNYHLTHERERLQADIVAIREHSTQLLHQERAFLQRQLLTYQHHLALAKQHTKHLQATIMTYDPRTTLQRGYALVHKGEVSITRRAQLHIGDELTVNFADGAVRVQVLADEV